MRKPKQTLGELVYLIPHIEKALAALVNAKGEVKFIAPSLHARIVETIRAARSLLRHAEIKRSALGHEIFVRSMEHWRQAEHDAANHRDHAATCDRPECQAVARQRGLRARLPFAPDDAGGLM